ncbi:MAG TPA: hypothetical protein DCQ04_14140 [Actinobacteria bacterium]|nr:hypothetical protein [Actinomycetota bacterium]
MIKPYEAGDVVARPVLRLVNLMFAFRVDLECAARTPKRKSPYFPACFVAGSLICGTRTGTIRTGVRSGDGALRKEPD